MVGHSLQHVGTVLQERIYVWSLQLVGVAVVHVIDNQRIIKKSQISDSASSMLTGWLILRIFS